MAITGQSIFGLSKFAPKFLLDNFKFWQLNFGFSADPVILDLDLENFSNFRNLEFHFLRRISE